MNSQKGIAQMILILIAALGLVSFLLISNTFSFNNRLLSQLFPKPASKAAEEFKRKEPVPGEILLKFKAGVGEKIKIKIRKENGLEKKNEIPQIGIEIAKVPENTRDQTIKVLKKDLNVEYAEPNFMAKAQAVTNDPSFPSQWDMLEINAANYSGQSAWDITTGDPSVRIAIVDSGIMENHEDISGKVVASRNFTPSSTVDDICKHGTHVAGTAAAQTNNSKGVAGVGYRSSLMNVKVLDKDPDGDCWGEYSWIANGIVWATDNGAKVINMSLGGIETSITLENAVNYAWNKGVVLVAAAGNYGDDQPLYPAFYNNVIAVAATNMNHVKSSFSNWGSWVDVAAPGNVILSTYANDPYTTYAYMTGTSMATPHVAGIAALVWAKGTCSTNTCVRSAIEQNADKISGTGVYFTYGLVNAYKSVGGVGSSFPTPVPTPAPKNPPCDSLGDVDQDGLVSISDADLALQLWAGITQLTSEQKRRADVNVDSNINSLDAQYMVRYLNNEITTFPGCSATPIIVPTPPSFCQDPCGLDTITCSGGNILTSCQQGGLCSRYTIGTPCDNISPGALGTVTSCTSIPACTTATPTPVPTPTPSPTPTPTPTPTSALTDFDGDGFQAGVPGNTCPNGRLCDCYDKNIQAKPGQGGWFTTTRGTSAQGNDSAGNTWNSYDYDCNSSIQTDAGNSRSSGGCMSDCTGDPVGSNCLPLWQEYTYIGTDPTSSSCGTTLTVITACTADQCNATCTSQGYRSMNTTTGSHVVGCH